MEKTLKQISDELGIDKQKVYRFIKSNHINEAHQSGQSKWYSEAVQEQIKRHFSDNATTSRSASEPHHEAVNEAVINELREQLKKKDEQIANITEALINAQKLHGIAEQKLKMIEDKSHEEESAEEEQKKHSAEQELKLSDLQTENEKLRAEIEAEKNKSWWDKLRGK